jgi:hypothetical protein
LKITYSRSNYGGGLYNLCTYYFIEEKIIKIKKSAEEEIREPAFFFVAKISAGSGSQRKIWGKKKFALTCSIFAFK